MDTFWGHLQLSALGDLDRLLGLVAAGSLDVLDLGDNVHALEDLAENDVTAIEPPDECLSAPGLGNRRSGNMLRDNLRGNDSGDEELRAVGVLSGVGHGQHAGLGVLELEVLVGELLTVDYSQEI